MKHIKIKDWSEIPKNYSGKIEFANGNIEYSLNGILHNLNGPARIWYDGHEAYYINDEFICSSRDEDYKQYFYNSLIRKRWVLLENMKKIKNI